MVILREINVFSVVFFLKSLRTTGLLDILWELLTRTFLTAFVKLSVPSIGPLLEKQGNDKGQIQDWWMLFLFLAELLEEEKINNRHPH